MSRCHELGQSWIPEEGIVREANTGDVEVDQLSAVVVACAEGHREADLPQGAGGTASSAREGLPGLESLQRHVCKFKWSITKRSSAKLTEWVKSITSFS